MRQTSPSPSAVFNDTLLDDLVAALSGNAQVWSSMNRPHLLITASIQEADGGDGTSIHISGGDPKHGPSTILKRAIDIQSILQPGLPLTSESPVSPTDSQDGDESFIQYQGPQKRIRAQSPTDTDVHDPDRANKARRVESTHPRKSKGSLRPRTAIPSADSASHDSQRQMAITKNAFPRRAKPTTDLAPSPASSSLAKFVQSVWEQIHGGISLEPAIFAAQAADRPGETTAGAMSLAAPLHLSTTSSSLVSPGSQTDVTPESFTLGNAFCRQVLQTSRACRSVEVIVQARWVELFDAYVAHLTRTEGLSALRGRMAAMGEACRDFGWNEKEMRNKMAVWRGYKEIKDAGGWVPLVFAGMGLYRMCKYRVGLEPGPLSSLKAMRSRLEIAADTIRPEWRKLLVAVGEPTQLHYRGHPHDWVAQADGDEPLPLSHTYRHQEVPFTFRHVDECLVDEEHWPDEDPRRVPMTTMVTNASAAHICDTCGQPQSDEIKDNQCRCFPSLFGGQRQKPPVQIFRTKNGRNNGVQALLPFSRGSGIGEFVGLLTSGIQGVDVMNSAVGARKYQIWQGRESNFTRFVNHSCNPNALFHKFTWLGMERILLVSKGIEAGAEITVDYSDSYWEGLDKVCLCGEACCRYQGRSAA
ncbi:SET domain-containing protein [Emericellopsis atlantica]|uniref:SET domain-containing protein n=1 Tax=Emericellopsis atlantica TaxID=2614577 RepID=A0A9P8CTF5_9HYPO|nr:SET domain-containing protein [Emericellopsis atlantica]KAG9259109.1 SET domain-containing protein [Emericellopsis atlantica]